MTSLKPKRLRGAEFTKKGTDPKNQPVTRRLGFVTWPNATATECLTSLRAQTCKSAVYPNPIKA